MGWEVVKRDRGSSWYLLRRRLRSGSTEGTPLAPLPSHRPATQGDGPMRGRRLGLRGSLEVTRDTGQSREPRPSRCRRTRWSPVDRSRKAVCGKLERAPVATRSDSGRVVNARQSAVRPAEQVAVGPAETGPTGQAVRTSLSPAVSAEQRQPDKDQAQRKQPSRTRLVNQAQARRPARTDEALTTALHITGVMG